MRKIIFFSFLLGVLFLLPVRVWAKLVPTPTPLPTPTPGYILPYPGMLPDSPIYKIKVLRDKILLFLTFDPAKKAARHLQMADKEFVMALKLAEKGKIALAKHTAFKAEHHMTLINTEIAKFISSDKKINLDFIDRVHLASLKHQELLAGMKNRAKETIDLDDFKTITEFSIRNNQDFTNLIEQKKAEEEILESDDLEEESILENNNE